jgi:hypothetical protein
VKHKRKQEVGSKATTFNEFPSKLWEQMDAAEQQYFRDLPEDFLVARWDSPEGREIKEKIISINLEYGHSKSYRAFVGTIKSGWGKEPAKRN